MSTTDEWPSLATRLKTPLTLFNAIGAGSHSRFYKFPNADLETFALKTYFYHASDQRNSLSSKPNSTRFLWDNVLTDIT